MDLDEDEYEGQSQRALPTIDNEEITDKELKPLFTFNFNTLTNNGIMVSHGQWNGQAPGSYQFVISSFDKFIITTYPKGTDSNDEGQAIIFSGRKLPVSIEKTFFQRYSMIIMIGVFLFFNVFVQGKTRQYSQQQSQQRRRPDDQVEDKKEVKKKS